jgi:hypothetical protein
MPCRRRFADDFARDSLHLNALPSRYLETDFLSPKSFRPLLHSRMREAGGTRNRLKPFGVRITCRSLDDCRESLDGQ